MHSHRQVPSLLCWQRALTCRLCVYSATVAGTAVAGSPGSPVAAGGGVGSVRKPKLLRTTSLEGRPSPARGGGGSAGEARVTAPRCFAHMQCTSPTHRVVPCSRAILLSPRPEPESSDLAPNNSVSPAAPCSPRATRRGRRRRQRAAGADRVGDLTAGRAAQGTPGSERRAAAAEPAARRLDHAALTRPRVTPHAGQRRSGGASGSGGGFGAGAGLGTG
jgi:hypothetical protein